MIFTIAIDERKRRWPVEIRRGHWSGPQTARQIIDVHQVHNPNVIVVENNAYQDTLLDWIRMLTPDLSIRLKPFTTGKNKADEEIGLPSLAAELENESWVIATGGRTPDELEGNWGVWYEEMSSYPVAPLSDTVMACWFAREGVRIARSPAFMVSSEDIEEQRRKLIEEGKALPSDFEEESIDNDPRPLSRQWMKRWPLISL